jgi:glyoxylase-like metal-dependent hydrolase (beta-lactamase superfamily II)
VFVRTTAGECPDTVNPSLWRQSQLTAIHGLFEVTDGIYQVRGMDLSNMTLVEGDTGVIVIDPLVSAEVAAAGLALYREHRGERPVTAVIFTHSHIDHFGGVLGVVDADTSVPIVAPEGFLEQRCPRTSTQAGRCCAAAPTTPAATCRSAPTTGWAWDWAPAPPKAPWVCSPPRWTSPTPGRKKPWMGYASFSRSPRAPKPRRR